MPVYWMALVPIPKSILGKLKSMIFAFLWGSSWEKKKYYLVDWQLLSKPTAHGGWGIKNLGWFSTSLRLKSFWYTLSGNGLWFNILSVKYLKKRIVLTWIRRKAFMVTGVSVIWKGFISSITWLGRGLTWHAGNGESIRVGLDPIIGMGSSFSLPCDLWDYLKDYGIISLAQARNYSLDAQTYWLTAEDLDLGGEWKLIWNSYIIGLEYGRIRLNPRPDSLLWSFKSYSGSISAAIAYECITTHHLDPLSNLSFVLHLLWKIKIPTKI